MGASGWVSMCGSGGVCVGERVGVHVCVSVILLPHGSGICHLCLYNFFFFKLFLSILCVLVSCIHEYHLAYFEIVRRLFVM